MKFHAMLSAFARITGLNLLPILAMLALVALAGCNSGSLTEGLDSARSGNNPRPAQGITTNQSQTAGPTASGQTGQQTAAISPAPLAGTTGTSVAFLPVSNAPQNAVTTLAQSIRDAAERNALPVVPSVQQGAQYQVKGYFSALEDGSGTLLVYVWDVLDRNNKRVYRINGQEQGASSASDPWAAVTPQMLNRVAESTVSQLKSWLATRDQSG